MKRWTGILMVVGLAVVPAFAQQAVTMSKGDPVATPKDLDTVRAQLYYAQQANVQLQYQMEQQRMGQLQAQFVDIQKKLSDWEADQRKKYGWGDDVIYDGATDKWYRAARPAAPQVKTPPVQAPPGSAPKGQVKK